MNKELNHGKVGHALYIKFTVDKFNSRFKEPQDIKDGDYYTVKEAEKKFKGLNTCVPIKIDNTTKGNYECGCWIGIEIH